jgi:hypothetical protein
MRLAPYLLQSNGAYCDRGNLTDYLANFSGQQPIKAVVCPYAQDAGAGMGLGVFALFFFGSVGLALTVRTQHPGPLVVALMLSAGAVAFSVPGAAIEILALVFAFSIAALGIYLYKRAQTSL